MADNARARATGQQQSEQPRVSRTSKQRRESRQRRRDRLGLSGYHPDEFLATPIEGDPLAHLEAMRLAYVKEIERCAALALLPTDRAAILLKLAKLTSLGRVKIDVAAQLSKLTVEPDLRELTAEQLAAIMRGEAPELVAIDVTPTVDDGKP